MTDQLVDVALGELGVVAQEQPCLIVGAFNVEPTKIPCLARGTSAGLWVDLEAAWPCASGRLPVLPVNTPGVLLGGPGVTSWLSSCSCSRYGLHGSG